MKMTITLEFEYDPESDQRLEYLCYSMIHAAFEASASKPAEAVADDQAPNQGVHQGSVIRRARERHPHLGPQQVEILEVLEDIGSVGTNTTVLSERFGWTKQRAHQSLKALFDLGFVERTSRQPHVYRLARSLAGADDKRSARS